jgi:hypothetical protein
MPSAPQRPAIRCDVLLVAMLTACGSSKPSPAPPAPVVAANLEPDAPSERDEDMHRAELVASHRKLEEEQQSALALTCSEPVPHDPHPRCFPSCYATEPVDPRAAKPARGRGPVAIDHLLCEPPGGSDAGPFVLADELDAEHLRVRAANRVPAAHRKGSWQATIEAWLVEAQPPKPPRGDVFVVTGALHPVTHPLTKEHLRCVTVTHYTRSLHGPLGACGDAGDVACEAGGNAAVRGINVVHYRLAEAKALQSSDNQPDCQRAALEAIAVARGMPRWRQYAKLNVRGWTEHRAYRTRFDGVLDEDTLFAAAAALGNEAESLYSTCGGGTATTTPDQEQSFHGCW